MPLSRNAVPNLMIRVPLARVATVCGFSRHAVNPFLGARGARPCAPRSRKPAHSRNPATPLISRIVKSKSVSDAPAARAAMVYGFSRHTVNPSLGSRARRPWRARSRKAIHYTGPRSYCSSNLARRTLMYKPDLTNSLLSARVSWIRSNDARFCLPSNLARSGLGVELGVARPWRAWTRAPSPQGRVHGVSRNTQFNGRAQDVRYRICSHPGVPREGFTACLETTPSIAGPGYWHRHSGRGSVWT